ncbi:peptide chain release factor subunit 3 [Nematocida displodere]|uniref:Elongation factor 1 alpha-like protein n=1 Tax=Nematocida displodere TaxID=1805483 RepID=A0A177ECX9_9MICR|nr:peptide chain release factor subunit 3 [Nematocida displodere]
MELENELQRLTVTKKHINIVFIGHVDAGKSTIGGQILYLSGKVDKRTLEKYEKESREKNRESWYLSWALDSNPEEREKGKTTELGQAYFELENTVVQILDAPGHKMYVPSMIQGVSQADVAIIVISARQNEFEAGFEKGGQTREHIYLAKASGIPTVCVVVNKMDEPTVQWSEERYSQIINSTQKMLGALFGKENLTYIPISGFLGENIEERVPKSTCGWYKGPSFFEYLSALKVPRNETGPLSVAITDATRDMGNSLVFARVEQGILEKKAVKLMPGSRKITITSIAKEEEEIDRAGPGECVRLKFKETEDLSPGDMLTSPDTNSILDSNYFMAQLSILDAKSLITKGYGAIMHMGSRTVPVSIGELYKKTDNKIHKVKFTKTGDKVVAEVFATEIIPLEVFQAGRRSGIFTLRDESRTVGFGKVLKIKEKK